MAYKENQGVQAPAVKRAIVMLAMLTSGAQLATISLPSSAEVIGGSLVVDEVFNSTSSDAFEIGDLDLSTRYLGSTSVQALGRTALVPTGLVATTENQKTVTIKWTSGGGVPTTGEAHVVLEYIELGRSDFDQG